MAIETIYVNIAIEFYVNQLRISKNHQKFMLNETFHDMRVSSFKYVCHLPSYTWGGFLWFFFAEMDLRFRAMWKKHSSEETVYRRTADMLLFSTIYIYMGVSENSVPLHPMVNDHYPY